MCDYDKCKTLNIEYARAYIFPQKFKNLFSIEEAFNKGTIFRDLDKPYSKNNKYNC